MREDGLDASLQKGILTSSTEIIVNTADTILLQYIQITLQQLAKPLGISYTSV